MLLRVVLTVLRTAFGIAVLALATGALSDVVWVGVVMVLASTVFLPLIDTPLIGLMRVHPFLARAVAVVTIILMLWCWLVSGMQANSQDATSILK